MRQITLRDIQRNPTARLQLIMDDGESIRFPAGDIDIEEDLIKRSVGQMIEGEGINRTRLIQQTEGKGAFKHALPSTGSVDCQWRGGYATNSMGNGSIGGMTIEAAHTNTGTAIECGTGDFAGDYFHGHDLFIYRFAKHLSIKGIGQVTLDRITCKNALTIATAFGTGVEILGAACNAHLINRLSVSGMALGLDLLGYGTAVNALHVDLCDVGERVRGFVNHSGGHIESTNHPLLIGHDGAGGWVNVAGMHIASWAENENYLIELNHGSVLTGSATGGPFPESPVVFVKCTLAGDFAYLLVYPGTDEGTVSAQAFQYYNAAMGITRRFSPFKVFPLESWIPPASVKLVGAIYHVHETDRLIECVNNGGTPAWVDR